MRFELRSCVSSRPGDVYDYYLHIPPEYAEYAKEQKAADPERTSLDIAATAMKTFAGPYAPYVMTHWAGINYLTGEIWPYHQCAFDEAVAKAMETQDKVLLTKLPDETLRGWYICRACNLIVHDPLDWSCSKSCPVCEAAAVMHGERGESNDRLRFRHSYRYGVEPKANAFDPNRAYDGLAATQVKDVPDTYSLLMIEANKHIAYGAIAAFLYRFTEGHIDTQFDVRVVEHFRWRNHTGATAEEFKACGAFHAAASKELLQRAAAQIEGGVE